MPKSIWDYLDWSNAGPALPEHIGREKIMDPIVNAVQGMLTPRERVPFDQSPVVYPNKNPLLNITQQHLDDAEAVGGGFAGSTGKPPPMIGGYHGTVAPQNFKRFKKSEVDLGTHFADNPDVAVQYALGTTTGDFGGLTQGARTIPVVADIRKPLNYPTDPINWGVGDWVIKGVTDSMNRGYKPPRGLLEDMFAAERSGWEKNFVPMLKDRGHDSVLYPHATNPIMEAQPNSYMALDPKQVTPRLSPKGQELIKARGILEPSKKLTNLDDVHYWNELPEAEKHWYDAPSGPKGTPKGTTMTWNPNIPNEQALVEGLLSKLKSGELDMAGYLKEHGKIFGLE
jgi:hypothetical protein